MEIERLKLKEEELVVMNKENRGLTERLTNTEVLKIAADDTVRSLESSNSNLLWKHGMIKAATHY